MRMMPLKVSTALGVCVYISSGKSVHSMHRAFQSLKSGKVLLLTLIKGPLIQSSSFAVRKEGWGAKCLAEKLAGAGQELNKGLHFLTSASRPHR